MELLRVPDAMSLLASHEVTLDGQGPRTDRRRFGRRERGRSEDRSST
ncbi:MULTISPECIES: gas vesicle protein GvpO [Streptomyces]